MKFFPSVVADAAIFLFLSSAVFAQHYTQVNLDANVTGAAEATDPQLVNAFQPALPPVRSRTPTRPTFLLLLISRRRLFSRLSTDPSPHGTLPSVLRPGLILPPRML